MKILSLLSSADPDPGTFKSLAKTCTEFLRDRSDFLGWLEYFAYAAFAVAILALLFQAVATIRKLLAAAEAPKAEGVRAAATQIFAALPGIIDSLAKAPAAVVLIVFGFLIVWLPDFGPSESCLSAVEANASSDNDDGNNALSTAQEMLGQKPASATSVTTVQWKSDE